MAKQHQFTITEVTVSLSKETGWQGGRISATLTAPPCEETRSMRVSIPFSELAKNPMFELQVLSQPGLTNSEQVWLFTLPGAVDPSVMAEWLARIVDRAIERSKAPDLRSLSVVPALRTGTMTESVVDSVRSAAREVQTKSLLAGSKYTHEDKVVADTLWMMVDAALAAARQPQVLSYAWNASLQARDVAADAVCDPDSELAMQVSDAIELLKAHANG